MVAREMRLPDKYFNTGNTGYLLLPGEEAVDQIAQPFLI
jgi:hypothetical protein